MNEEKKTLYVTACEACEVLVVEQVILHAFRIGLLLISTGYINEGRRVVHGVSQFRQLEFLEIPFPSERLLTERGLAFITEAAGPSSDPEQELASRVVSSALLDKHEWDQRQCWGADIFRGHSQLDRSAWADRINPLDALRCAYQYTCPPDRDRLPSKSEEATGLEALQYFINETQGKKHFGFRRAQAFACAIEVAARSSNLDVAFNLAKRVAQEQPESLLNPQACGLILCRHFIGELFNAAIPSSYRFSDLAEIRKALGIDDSVANEAYDMIMSKVKAFVAIGNRCSLGGMTLRGVLLEYARTAKKSSSRKTTSVPVNGGQIVFRESASDVQLERAGSRLQITLPSEYKNILRISNGWDESTIPSSLPLFSIEDVGFVELKTPISVSGPRPGPYDPNTTASKCLRLDAGPLYLPESSHSPPAMLLMILEQDLPLNSKVHSTTKRVKKNDGSFGAVDFQRGDYRIVLWTPSHDGNEHRYFYTIREYIQSQIEGFDKLLGIQRGKVKMSGERNHPGKNGDSEGETEDDEGDGEEGDRGDEREESEEDRSEPGSDGEDENMIRDRPACWYGVECRTQHHNAAHAAKYDHTGSNTHKG